MRWAASALILAFAACGGSDPAEVRDARGTPDAAADVRLADVEVGDAAVTADAAPDAGLPGCMSRYRPGVTTGPLRHPDLLEQSGLAASRVFPDRLWTHNDSGDGPYVYAVGLDGMDLGRTELRGIDPFDFEDVAVAKCPDGLGSCVWLADIGDNAMRREEVRVYAFPEPDAAAVDVPWTFRFQFEGGPRDAEALVVQADGQRLWVLDKVEDAPSGVFQADAPWPNGLGRLRRVATFQAPGPAIPMGRMITGADLHPSDQRLVVRVYAGIYEYILPRPGALDTLGSLMPFQVTLGPLSENQGEAIAYGPDGQDLYSVSESVTLEPGEDIHVYRCPEDP